MLFFFPHHKSLSWANHRSQTEGLGSNTWQRRHDNSSFPHRYTSSSWHRCLAQVCSPAGTQSLVSEVHESPGQQSQLCPGSQMIPHQTAARSCLSLGLRGTDSFVCTHSFGHLDCAFTVTSALTVLLPGHQSHHTPSGRRSRDFWSTYYVCKGLLNPNSSHVCIHPFTFFVCLSSSLSFSHCFL